MHDFAGLVRGNLNLLGDQRQSLAVTHLFEHVIGNRDLHAQPASCLTLFQTRDASRVIVALFAGVMNGQVGCVTGEASFSRP